MGKKEPLLEVDPLALPIGMLLGPWRIRGWGGRGSYGTLYRVEKEGQEAAGSFALKLAIHPRDERFKREAWLLSHIQSPHVPQLYDQGVWEHSSGAFPFLVMEWIEGEPLYAWAARRNPTQHEVLRLLAQVARALEATHAAGGVHRDVKGDNVLVRAADGRAFLTDFGAGHFRGALTLTSKLLPPSTPAYRSPEAWAFLRAFRRHPTIVYPASACDDLFALGVMAYRLVTDEYPPPTDLEERGGEVWCEDGPGPLPPRALNPLLGPELDSLILRALAIPPNVRFNGSAQEAAQALEKAAEGIRPEAGRLLFRWEHEYGSSTRSLERVRRAAEQDAAAREEFQRREAEERNRSRPAVEQARPPVFAPAWGAAGAVAFLGVLLVMVALLGPDQAQQEGQAASEMDSRDGGIVALGDRTASAPSGTQLRAEMVQALGGPLPEKPLPGQRTPPCNKFGEVELRDGCWYLLGAAKPPCKDDAYDWKGACYLPSFPPQRQPTSKPP
ncbi:serine/threonine-protein kinase [Hyalangium sp.]|uniref:serine/threonine protein kinase n=1 Tax=Hyalangium sp. TaxID=2028555 RepID=UPI002D70BF00|nr:serine/threonine-protein kinase [Hyalangium sp.]HYH94932.1 serine/threonine-protein kinase [Hyalangium sp.]